MERDPVGSLNILFRLLAKCNQYEAWRFSLNNIIVPVFLLVLVVLTREYNSVIIIPNTRIDGMNLTNSTVAKVINLFDWLIYSSL